MKLQNFKGKMSVLLPIITFVGAQTSTNRSRRVFGRQWYSNFSAVVQFWLIEWHIFLLLAFIHSVMPFGQAATAVRVGIDWRHPSPLWIYKEFESVKRYDEWYDFKSKKRIKELNFKLISMQFWTSKQICWMILAFSHAI